MNRKSYVLLMLSLALSFFLIGTGMHVSAASPTHSKSALIVIDPGYSGFSRQVAQEICRQLQVRKITAQVVKVNAFKDEYLTGKDLLILGGPTYAHRHSKGVQSFLAKLNRPGMNTLLFQTGGIDCAGITSLRESALTKGLHVVGLMTITIKEVNRREEKVHRLLESIE